MAAHTLFTPPASARPCRPDCGRPNPFSPSSTRIPWAQTVGNPWRGSFNLCLRPKRTPITAAGGLSLPTANPDRVSSVEKVPKWSWKAITAFGLGEMVAWKLEYTEIGTEALLMAILDDGTNLASKYLWEKGITPLKVREETVKLFGMGTIYGVKPRKMMLTEAAQRALDWAVDEKLKLGEDGEITTIHMLLGVWSEEEAPGHKVLASLGFSNDNVKELKSLISQSKLLED